MSTATGAGAIAAVVLAAGRSTRYRAAGGTRATKLVDLFRGEPLVRWPVRAALAAGLAPVVVVTGHARESVLVALAGLPVASVHNPRFAEGLATSLAVGLGALPPAVTAAVILLGDMPLVDAETIALLGAAAAPEADAVVPWVEKRRGNPVLLRRPLFAAAQALTGDEGARRLLQDPMVVTLEVPMSGEAARLDVDEPGAFEA